MLADQQLQDSWRPPEGAIYAPSPPRKLTSGLSKSLSGTGQTVIILRKGEGRKSKTGHYQNKTRPPWLETNYALSSDHVCSPHSHLNMRTVRPLWGLSIVLTKAGFLSHWLQALNGAGSKLEKTSFLNSLLMGQAARYFLISTKYQSGLLFRKT